MTGYLQRLAARTGLTRRAPLPTDTRPATPSPTGAAGHHTWPGEDTAAPTTNPASNLLDKPASADRSLQTTAPERAREQYRHTGFSARVFDPQPNAPLDPPPHRTPDTNAVDHRPVSTTTPSVVDPVEDNRTEPVHLQQQAIQPTAPPNTLPVSVAGDRTRIPPVVDSDQIAPSTPSAPARQPLASSEETNVTDWTRDRRPSVVPREDVEDGGAVPANALRASDAAIDFLETSVRTTPDALDVAPPPAVPPEVTLPGVGMRLVDVATATEPATARVSAQPVAPRPVIQRDPPAIHIGRVTLEVHAPVTPPSPPAPARVFTRRSPPPRTPRSQFSRLFVREWPT